jgi:hypothetical protein
MRQGAAGVESEIVSAGGNLSADEQKMIRELNRIHLIANNADSFFLAASLDPSVDETWLYELREAHGKETVRAYEQVYAKFHAV